MQSPIIIFGSTGAVGLSIAQKLKKEGYKIILHGKKNSNKLKNISKKLKQPSIYADLSKVHEIENIVKKIKKNNNKLLGIVFSIGEIFPKKLTLNSDWSIFQSQINLQIKSFHYILQKLKPLLEKQKTGSRIIVILSEFLIGSPPIKISPYLVAKSGLEAYCKVISQEIIKQKIRLFMIAPGMLRSNFTSDIPEKYMKIVEKDMPEKKMTTPDDISQICSFLMKKSADSLYGTLIPVSRAKRR